MQKLGAMSRFETTFRNAVASAERDVMIEQIRKTPQMSLAELGKLATGDFSSLLKGITIGEVLGLAAGKAKAKAPVETAKPSERKAGRSTAKGRKAKAKADKPKAEKAKADKPKAKKAKDGAPKRAKGVDTRTPVGREAYDQAVLDAVVAAGKAASAPELTAIAGGTPLQIRTALGRLIERGLVKWTGQARGTRYTPA